MRTHQLLVSTVFNSRFFRYYHIKVRPYVCTTCGREFYKRTKCGQHIAFDHGNWPREKADKEWKFYLRENPHMIQVNSITEEINQLLSLPPEATEEYKATQGKTCRKGRKPDWQPSWKLTNSINIKLKYILIFIKLSKLGIEPQGILF